jgi:DUF1365 family protein
MEKKYDGILFDKSAKVDHNYCYMVYLKELKLLSRITCSENLDNYTQKQFKIYLFEDQDKTKKKIRLQIVDNITTTGVNM